MDVCTFQYGTAVTRERERENREDLDKLKNPRREVTAIAR